MSHIPLTCNVCPGRLQGSARCPTLHVWCKECPGIAASLLLLIPLAVCFLLADIFLRTVVPMQVLPAQSFYAEFFLRRNLHMQNFSCAELFLCRISPAQSFSWAEFPAAGNHTSSTRSPSSRTVASRHQPGLRHFFTCMQTAPGGRPDSKEFVG